MKGRLLGRKCDNVLKVNLTHYYYIISIKTCQKALTSNGKYSIIIKRKQYGGDIVSEMNISFPKLLKQCQLERHMSANQFAKHIGRSRPWIQSIYSTNPNTEKYGLSQLTMYMLNEKLGIPYDVMDKYNNDVKQNKLGDNQ